MQDGVGLPRRIPAHGEQERLRPQAAPHARYRCAVIAGARPSQQTIDNTHSQLISGLETGRTQANAGLGAVRRAKSLAAIDAALRATLTALSAQEYAQRQSVNDTGYMKQLAIEQLAHASAATWPAASPRRWIRWPRR